MDEKGRGVYNLQTYDKSNRAICTNINGRNGFSQNYKETEVRVLYKKRQKY